MSAICFLLPLVWCLFCCYFCLFVVVVWLLLLLFACFCLFVRSLFVFSLLLFLGRGGGVVDWLDYTYRLSIVKYTPKCLTIYNLRVYKSIKSCSFDWGYEFRKKFHLLDDKKNLKGFSFCLLTKNFTLRLSSSSFFCMLYMFNFNIIEKDKQRYETVVSQTHCAFDDRVINIFKGKWKRYKDVHFYISTDSEASYGGSRHFL